MTIVTVQNCISTQPWHTKHILSDTQPGLVYRVQIPMPGDPPNEYICDCKGFSFRGYCKHQTQVSICEWQELIGPETQTDQQARDHLCPRCGNKTIEELAYEND